MSSHRGHGWGEKAAHPEGHYDVMSSTPAVTALVRSLQNGHPVGARTLGDLKNGSGEREGASGNGGEYAAGGRVRHAQATCWCERSVVDVTWDEVVAGVTRSCGTARCDQLGSEWEDRT